MDYLLCFRGKKGRTRARCLERLSEALSIFAKLSFISAHNQETAHSLVTCCHLLACHGLHRHLRWSSSVPSCAEVGGYISLIKLESRFLIEKWSLQSRECDNHDCGECSTYCYKSKNSLCKEGSIQSSYVLCLLFFLSLKI